MTTIGATISPAEAEQVQLELREQLDLTSTLSAPPRTVGGLDVSYEVGSARIAAGVVVLETATLEVVEESLVVGTVSFPYIPGLLAFREVPSLVEALSKLSNQPDVLICDGYGIAHPRRFGLACHMGVLTGLPTFGVAKTSFTAQFDPPGPDRGDWSALVDGADVVGRALRTQRGVNPVFVSVGHRIGLDDATSLTLTLSPRYRLPETTRRADSLSRQALR